MRTWSAFFKKELRGGQLWILLVFFTVLGVMNPAIAKLTPKMPALLADSLAESGMQVTHVGVNALTSWTQYFKNMPIGLVAFFWERGQCRQLRPDLPLHRMVLG